MILLVDDKQENLYSLKSLLQLHAYDVDTASSGEEALRKVLKNEFDLIILDVQMPEMDGFEVAETIAGYSKTKDTPILFLSAVNIDKRFIAKGYSSGGLDYITKPFDPDLLLLKVKTFCRLSAQTKELKRIQEALKKENESRKAAQKELENANLLLEEKVANRTRELLQMNRELESSNAELQQYASVASHDLQEPLRKIITFLNLVNEKYLSAVPEANLYVEKIVSSADRMRNLINDLLNYSRLSADTQFVPTNLSELVEQTLADLDLSITEKGAVINLQPLPVAEVMPGQMRQVFQNIIGNALKFSRAGTPPEISIWSDRAGSKSLEAPAVADGPWLRIYIRDNGIGFDELYLGKIFTLFQRLHGRAEYEGTGIGLAIVRKILEKHGGLITAQSREGKGATFLLLLPLRQGAEKNDTPAAEATARQTAGPAGG